MKLNLVAMCEIYFSPWEKCLPLEWMEHSIWALKESVGIWGLSKLWPVWGCLEQAVQSPPVLLLLLIYYYYLDSDPCYSMTLCFPGPQSPRPHGRMGSLGHPLSSVLAMVWGCPASHLPSLLTGPLALSVFTICLVRSPWPRQGCPWGHLGRSPQ